MNEPKTTVKMLIEILKQYSQDWHIHIYKEDELILHRPERPSSGDAYIRIEKSE